MPRGVDTAVALWWSIGEYEGPDVWSDVLVRWLRLAKARVVEVVGPLADGASAERVEPNSSRSLQSASEELYALGRVNELLIERTFAGALAGELSEEHYRTFFERLDMTVIEPSIFHPFFHEIVDVDQSSSDAEPLAVLQIVWPGLMLGDLMFSRAGTVVRAGRDVAAKGVADRSPLYYCYHRPGRPTVDPGHGWGANSQFGNYFRRDYLTSDRVVFNIDGRLAPDEPDDDPQGDWNPELTIGEKRELLTHRCLLRREVPSPSDLWPYHLTLTVSSAPPRPTTTPT